MKTQLVMMLVPVTTDSIENIWDVTHHIPMTEIQQASFIGIIDPSDTTNKITVVKDRFSPFIGGVSSLQSALADHAKQVVKSKKRRIYDEH